MTKIITIGELVKTLESDYDSQVLINIGTNLSQYLEAQKQKDGKYAYVSRGLKEKWHCINLNGSSSKVCDVLALLKSYIPEHKDKCICVYDNHKFVLVTNKIQTIKTHQIQFNEDITELPQVKLELVDQTWKTFQDDIETFIKTMTDSGQKAVKTLQIAQLTMIKHPELGQIYRVWSHNSPDKLYHTYEDVRIDYPELTTEKQDTDLFDNDGGVFNCRLSRLELEHLCSNRKSPKYVINDQNSPISKDTLKTQYNISDSQIDKLFHQLNGVFVCRIPEILSALEK